MNNQDNNVKLITLKEVESILKSHFKKHGSNIRVLSVYYKIPDHNPYSGAEYNDREVEGFFIEHQKYEQK